MIGHSCTFVARGVALLGLATQCGCAPPADDCWSLDGIDPKISAQGGKWKVSFGDHTHVLLNTELAANQLRRLAPFHRRVCRLGTDGVAETGRPYLDEPIAAFASTASKDEDCNSHDPTTVRVINTNGVWEVHARRAVLASLPKEAQATILAAKMRLFPHQCFIGRRSDSSANTGEVVQYWRP